MSNTFKVTKILLQIEEYNLKREMEILHENLLKKITEEYTQRKRERYFKLLEEYEGSKIEES